MFHTTNVLEFGTLSPADKARWTQFILDNDVQFYKAADGNYVANVRLCNEGDPLLDLQMFQQEDEQDRRRMSSASSVTSSQAGARRTGAVSMFNYSAYPRFSSMFSNRDTLQPKKKPLSWLMRLVEDVYDVRYARDTADLKDDAAGADSDRISSVFPAFLFEYITKRYGLRSLVEQTGWDMLYSVHSLRNDHLEVEIFARFLEEFYDTDDLLFFLHVRSVVQQELNLNFRTRWAEMSRGGRERQPRTVFLSHRDCQQVSRVVFGSESEPLYKQFMSMIERNLVGQRRGRGADTRRIEVFQFLHLALAEYHEMNPDAPQSPTQGGDDGGESPRNGPGGSDPTGRPATFEEQERLFRDAEAQYFARMQSQDGLSDAASLRGRSVGGSVVDSEPAAPVRGGGGLRGNGMAASSAGVPSSLDFTGLDSGGFSAGELVMERSGPVPSTSRAQSAPPPSAGYGAPSASSSGAAMRSPPESQRRVTSRELLQNISQTMVAVSAAYLSELIPSDAGLPDAVRTQIQSEVRTELEIKVDAILASVISQSGPSSDGSKPADDLTTMYQQLVKEDGRGVVSVREFCESIIQSPAVREDIEPLVALLVTYANTRLQDSK